MDLDTLHARFGLDPALTRNVYLVGSRAQGCAREASDHDLFVVMDDDGRKWFGMEWLHREGWVPRDPARYRGARRAFIGEDDVQLWIFQPRTFAAMLGGHALCALECLFVPPPCRWKHTLELRGELTLELATLRRAVEFSARAHREKSARLFTTQAPRGRRRAPVPPDPAQARKLYAHALRFLEYGRQLARHGALVELAANNTLRADVVACDGGWDELDARFGPIFEERLAAFHRACADAEAHGARRPLA